MIRDLRYYSVFGKKALNASFILIGLNCALLLQNTTPATLAQCQSKMVPVTITTVSKLQQPQCLFIKSLPGLGN